MNYRHAYHAGSFTDVFKHIVLVALIQSLQRKEAPFCYLETHAGTGLYDLSGNAAQKTKEFEGGITKIQKGKNPPPLVQQFLSLVATANTAATPTYPGSPYFAKKLLRPIDRMVLCELHNEDYLSLKKMFRNDPRAAAHHQDGYLALKAFLPPKEKRGLVLIDPPYETIDEFDKITTELVKALKRFETGVYAIWFPIKIREEVERFYHMIQDEIKRPTLMCELTIFPDDLPTRLNGSGMLIINPPWQLDQALLSTLPWIHQQLNVAQGSYIVGNLA